VCGHCYWQLQLPAGDANPRVINLDPAIVTVFWNPKDLTDVLFYKIEYEGWDRQQGQLFYKQMIERDQSGDFWTITDYAGASQQKYQQTDQVKWPYPFAPILDWQNLPAPNEYYGKPDIQAVDGQDTINFVGSNIKRILRFHAHPKTVGKGFGARDVEVGPDEMILLKGADADVKNLEMQSDLASSRDFWMDNIDLFMMQHHVPNLLPSKVNVGSLSTFTLRILYADLLNLTFSKQLLYGDAIREQNRRLLIVAGRTEQRTTVIHWQDPLPVDKLAQAQELDIEANKLGTVSKETMQKELGRDPEVEKERMAEQTSNSLNLGSAILSAFNKGQGAGL